MKELFVPLLYLNIGPMRPSNMMNSDVVRVGKEVVVTQCGGFLTEMRAERR